MDDNDIGGLLILFEAQGGMTQRGILLRDSNIAASENLRCSFREKTVIKEHLEN